MSATEKRPYKQMLVIAQSVVEKLRPACHKIEIAGSLRRRKETIGDIEICALPVLHTNLLGEPLETSQVDDVLRQFPITLHLNGPKLKSFSFQGTSGQTYKIDLFLPLPECWPVIFMIRTGSSQFSQKMVTAKSQGGYRPEHLRVHEGRVWENGRAINLDDEAALFELWGMDYIAPEGRESC